MEKPKTDPEQKIAEEQESGEEQESEWAQNIRKSRIVGSLIFLVAITFFLIYFCNVVNKDYLKIFLYLSIIFFIVGILFMLPINNYVFDNKEYEQNRKVTDLILKLRSRAILFNNLSVLIFIITIFVIICSFYLLISSVPSIKGDPSKLDYSKLTSQVGSVVILIFLVQILFRVFKYLLRIGAFYNAKADAIELHKLKPTLDIYKLLDSLTPTTYDISDVESPNLYPKS